MTIDKTETAMELLFAAKINVPRASELAGRNNTKEDWDRTKQEFRQHCKRLGLSCSSRGSNSPKADYESAAFTRLLEEQ